MSCLSLGCPYGMCRESVDIEGRDSHHPLLPGESYQSPMGKAVWRGVAEESLPVNHGEAWEKLLSNHGRPPT